MDYQQSTTKLTARCSLRKPWFSIQKTKHSATRAGALPNQLEPKLHQTTKAKASLNTNFQRHPSTMIGHMKAEYFTQANEVAAVYALLPEWYGFDLYTGTNKYFCWLNTVNNLFNSERLLQRRPAYDDTINNVKLHRRLKRVPAMLSECELNQP